MSPEDNKGLSTGLRQFLTQVEHGLYLRNSGIFPENAEKIPHIEHMVTW